MHDIKFAAEPRSGEIKAKNLLLQGRIPIVLYGPAQESVSATIDKVELLRVVDKIAETTSIVLDLEGKEYRAFVKAIQRNKVTDSIIHMDLFVPSQGHKMELNIPIRLIGTPAGVDKGGILDHILNELPVSVLPKDIVDSIDIDISSLGIGSILRVKDLPIPEGMKPLVDGEDPVLLVELPRAAKEVEETEEELEDEGTEPEVINKGKKEEEEE